ncbi:hypothetical protein AWH56_024175 [Anaerobacillus isosaccharinicus]|uniref:Uncharacterized protein n=1 Tax=Anaerobacillus isosaccharinicus TaxID=1532552 RepID=A0A7S7L761_9BACI|nr:hypothetical protein [Anaerobacillus isosaccharinicus]MBA5585999.1 hypothetical protein [Anaerobacillus isosaccharinicus]QOY35723.1 hypothetical protein AWH56_024175 [Anaerobacillus isosaccharinicus]
MEWPMIFLVIIGIFLFIKVISKLIRIVIGIALLAIIAYYVFSIDLTMVMY